MANKTTNSFRRTYTSLKNSYHWKGIRKSVHQHCTNCKVEGVQGQWVTTDPSQNVVCSLKKILLVVLLFIPMSTMYPALLKSDYFQVAAQPLL